MILIMHIQLSLSKTAAFYLHSDLLSGILSLLASWKKLLLNFCGFQFSLPSDEEEEVGNLWLSLSCYYHLGSLNGKY